MNFLTENRTEAVGKVSGGFFGARTQKNHPFKAFLKEIQEDIYAYCYYLGISPTWQQKQLLDAMQEGRPNIAVRSGQGPGKSFGSSAAVTWWSLTHPYSLAVVTAPTMRQCKNVWLSQAQALVMNGDQRLRRIFKFMGTGYGILGAPKDMWGCYLATANRPEAFQGIHRGHLLMLCEESSGIDRPIIDTIKGTLSNAEGTYCWLQIGNPNTRDCAFFDCFHSLAGNPWHCIHWNGEETPESKWFSKRRNEELAEEFGIDSDVYRVRVLGEFPCTDATALISDADLAKCYTKEARDRAMAVPDNKKQIGIDLARFGGDENVIIARQGRMLITMEAYSHIDPNQAIDRAVMLQDTYTWATKDTVYVVDTSGMGEAAVGNLGGQRRMGRRVHEFYSQNSAHEGQKYANKISEAWCLFAKKVKAGEIYLGEKKDRKMSLQLTSRRYMVDKHGRIKIETKDEYKKRNADVNDGDLGKSPDRADSLVMAFYDHAHDSQRVVTA